MHTAAMISHRIEDFSARMLVSMIATLTGAHSCDALVPWATAEPELTFISSCHERKDKRRD
jgi:hypothetical protein